MFPGVWERDKVVDAKVSDWMVTKGAQTEAVLRNRRVSESRRYMKAFRAHGFESLQTGGSTVQNCLLNDYSPGGFYSPLLYVPVYDVYTNMVYTCIYPITL